MSAYSLETKSSCLYSPIKTKRINLYWLAIYSGFDFDLRKVDKEELEDAIIKANKDTKINGIIVYYPVFSNREDQRIQQLGCRRSFL